MNIIENKYKLSTIDKLMNNIFVFDKYYDSEEYNKGIEIIPIDFQTEAFNDIQWTYVLNRMEYCIDLCMHSKKTQELQYAIKAKELILDFISLYESDKVHKHIRTLDTGIRLISWDICIGFFLELKILNNQEFQKIKDSIKWQCRYLYQDFEDFQYLSNWGLTQSIGFLNSLKYVSLENKYIEFYQDVFFTHLDIQFFDDGMQWEQSIGYLNDVLERMLELNNSDYLSDKYYDVISRSKNVLNCMTNIDGKSILLGDGDEHDLTLIKQKLSCKLKDYKYVNLDLMYEEVYYLYGGDKVDKFDYQEQEICCLLEDTGMYIEKKDGYYFSFQNGSLGYGHGHFDNLHINLALNGEKVFTDSGRYTYVADDPLRKKYKYFTAHNGISMKTDIKYLDSFDNSGFFSYHPITIQERKFSKRILSTVMYEKKTAIRTIYQVNNDIFLIEDYANDDYQVNFKLYPEVEIEENNNEIKIGKNKFHSFLTNNLTINDDYISRKYKVQSKTKNIRIEQGKNKKIHSIICSDKYTVEQFNDFKYSNDLRLDETEKNFVMYKIYSTTQEYIIAINLRSSVNNDSVVIVDNKLIMASIFVIDMKNKEVDKYAY